MTSIPWPRWLPAILYAGLVFYASSQPLLLPSIPIPYIDKPIHFVEFAILSLLICWAQASSERPLKRAALLAIILSSLYGITDEVHQSFVPNRLMQVSDWASDTLGALGAGLLWVRLKGPHVG